MTRAAEARAILDPIGLDAILDWVEGGKSLRAIGRDTKTSRGAVEGYLRSQGAWEQYLSARQNAAEECDDLALTTLQNTDIEPARAREIAQHYRWRAKALNPTIYGDRQQIDLRAEVSDMTDEQLARRIAALQEAQEGKL